MKIKLDENLGRRCMSMLREAGHDVATVVQQQLAGANNGRVMQGCAGEKGCLLTLDLDFSNPLRVSPVEASGIAVIRPPAKPSSDDLLTAVETFIAALSSNEIDGMLWIVESGRIRIYRPDTDDEWADRLGGASAVVPSTMSPDLTGTCLTALTANTSRRAGSIRRQARKGCRRLEESRRWPDGGWPRGPGVRI